MTTDTDIKGYASLSADINKTKRDGTEEKTEGVVSAKLPELTLEMENGELIKLTNEWERIWKDSPKKTEWEKQIEENEKYWLGKQNTGTIDAGDRAVVDNIVFESL